MIWGMTASTFTLVHVLLSLVGIAAGLVVVAGLLAGKPFGGRLLPSHQVGIVSLVVLAAAILARYGFRLAGPWRPT
jgi:hypothetical protein